VDEVVQFGHRNHGYRSGYRRLQSSQRIDEGSSGVFAAEMTVVDALVDQKMEDRHQH
jgi:hypothetical protein